MSISSCHISRFSPEFQLACACCWVTPSEAEQQEIKRLLSVVDVPVFLDLVLTRHRIGSLAHAVFSRLSSQDLPPGLMQPLAEAARQNAVKALRATRTHIMLARWFALADVEWMPFKGTTLALRYYQDASTRHVNDLDIWVPMSKLEQARAVLQAQGFRLDVASRQSELAARGKRHAAYLAAYYHEEQHLSFEFGCLELHWRLADNPFQFRLAPDQILADADLIRLGGASVRVMTDVNLLLYLCEHGARHEWCRLKWLADLPRILADRDLDWPTVLARARQIGCYQSLILGLALCQDLFGWRPPPQVHEALATSRRLPLAMRLIRRRWDASAATEPTSFPKLVVLVLSELTLSVLLADKLRSIAQPIGRYLLSPNDLRVLKIPDRWFGLYYLLRPALYLARRMNVMGNSPRTAP